MNLLIIDDHPLFRQGLRTLLNALYPGIELSEASSLDEAVHALPPEPWRLILLDLHLPGFRDLTALNRLQELLPAIPVVVISGECRPSIVRAAIEQGAIGYIPKTLTPEKLAAALSSVLNGRLYLPDDAFAGEEEASGGLPELTTRQLEVLRGVIRGKSNKLVARDLGVSAETVKSHLAAAMRALGAHNRTELVFIAARRGLPLG